MNRACLTFLSAVALCAVTASDARAQDIITGPIGNALRPGATAPFDGLPYSIRYGYFPGVSYYSGMDRQKFEYLEYLDRVDRAEKFGYECPKPPHLYKPHHPPRRRVRLGFRWLFRK